MIYGFSAFGYEGSIVEVEAESKDGIQAMDIIGLADGEVRASREAIKSAIRNSGFEFPACRVLVSLSPADLKKDGGGFDLPVALAVLAQKDDCPRSQDTDVLVIGCLEPSGEVRNVNGVYAALLEARRHGIKHAIVPRSVNIEPPEGMHVSQVGSLRESYETLFGIEEAESLGETFAENACQKNEEFNVEFPEVGEESLDDIDGMDGLKFAMAAAVAGRHNAMVVKRPGVIFGVSSALEKITSLQPKLFPDETESVKRIRSVAGYEMLERDGERPFRIPHQTVTIEGMCGGGVNCHPGEISLAHNGILFLDEAAEFRTSVMQMLRVPLESGNITLCRAGRSTIFPARFQLLMATNPCPCGNFGTEGKLCLCSRRSIDNYWRKFSVPLLDRVAIRFDCANQDDFGFGRLSLGDLRSFVRNACIAQHTRQGKPNQDLSPEETERHIVLDADARRALDDAKKENGYSHRGVADVMKLARTVEDMLVEGSPTEKVGARSMEIAVKLRGILPHEKF